MLPFDCKYLISTIQDFGACLNFSIELKKLIKLKSRFIEFSIIFILCTENVMSDSLAKIAKKKS